MKQEDKLSILKEQFAESYPYAKLRVTRRKYKGKKRLYFTTIGCYKVESGRLISLYFPKIELIRNDYANLTYTYRNV